MDYIAFLQDAIQPLHGCTSEHIETVHIDERFEVSEVAFGQTQVN